MWKRMNVIVIGLLCVGLIAGQVIMADADEMVFVDVGEAHWAKASIQAAVDKEIVDGYPDGTFRPDGIVQRDHFIKMSLVAMGHRLEEGDHYWAEPYIEKAIELHLIAENEFEQVNVPITREEMASIIVKVTLNSEAALAEPQHMDIITNVYDFSSISDHYRQEAIEAFRFGLITGRKVNTFSPHEHSTRAEAVTVIDRYLHAEKRIPYTIPEDKLHIVLEDVKDRRNYFSEGTFVKVYAPVVTVGDAEPIEVDDIIETALVLQNTIETMEKGYGEIAVNRDEGVITSPYYSSAESIYRNDHMYTPEDRIYLNPHYGGADEVNLWITIRLSDWGEKKFSSYGITLYEPERVNQYNREVIESLFLHLFESDYSKAIQKYKSMLLKEVSSEAYTESITFNNRQVYILKYPSGTIEFFAAELRP